MIVFSLVLRGKTIIGEFGNLTQDTVESILAIAARNTADGTRLVPLGKDMLCAVMNASVGKEGYIFVAVIQSNEERDISFNFLDSVKSFLEKEISNPRMKSEQNAFLSKHIKTQMEKTNSKLGTSGKLNHINQTIEQATDKTRVTITNLLDNKSKLEDIEGKTSAVRDSAMEFEKGSQKIKHHYQREKLKLILAVGGCLLCAGFIFWKIL